jgi:NADH-quinone oxidoreductase subunit H
VKDLALSPPALSLYMILVAVGALMGGVAIMTWIERRLSGMIQYRLGPNRVGPMGLFQPVADGLKFVMKEDVIPADAFRPIFVIAPGLALVTALCAFSVIPIGPTVELFGIQFPLVIVDLDGGILLALAAASLGVYGIVCAGWASNSKYSLMGGLRASAQMISYELALALAVIGVVLVSGTLRPVEIVQQQAGWFWNWNVFGGWQLLGFAIFLIAGYAETNRLPFDMPEAESELVAGYHTEYSSMKFSMFFMAEYINMITSSALVVTLFLGGFNTGLPLVEWGVSGWALWGLQILAFVAKVGFFLVLYVWVRWTLPRFRYDQLMTLGWKRLFPLALVNLMAVAVLVAFGVVGR